MPRLTGFADPGNEPVAAAREGRGRLGISQGAALYVGSLIGPGLLLVPALAVQAAGPASVIAWAVLLVLSAPLAFTFAALGIRMPVSRGVSAYVERSFGARAGAATGACFLTAVLIGAPTVSLIGGYYVAALTGSGTATAVAVAVAVYVVVLATNAAGVGLSSVLQLVCAAILTLVVAIAVGVALPTRAGRNWTPFAPHGWWAVGTAANILIWLFVGWEAVAQFAGEFQEPRRQLPRAMMIAFGIVTVLYVGLAVATVEVITRTSSKVPLADLSAVGFGRWGRDATAVLAVALTMSTLNVYLGGASKLAASLAESGALPNWVGRDAFRSIPRRPMVVSAAATAILLTAIVAGIVTIDEMVQATSACFIAVYIMSTTSAARILRGAGRAAAILSCTLVVSVALFSAWYLIVPLAAGAGSTLAGRGRTGRHRSRYAAPHSFGRAARGQPFKTFLALHTRRGCRELLYPLVHGDPGSLTLRSSFVCPRCKGELATAADGMQCDSCRLVYPVMDGIPVLLIDEAKPPIPGTETGLNPK